jgi:hypothetical protein
MSSTLLIVISPFVLQALITFFDEFYFHHKRGLPLWERIGHPLDTLTVLACYVFLKTHSFSEGNLAIYLGLVGFSCLFITKDEFVHHENSNAPEQWLHSVLFILHPIVLLSMLFTWVAPESISFITIKDQQVFQTFFEGQFYIILLFLSYQIIYWSIPWKQLFQKKQRLTMTTTTTSVKIG